MRTLLIMPVVIGLVMAAGYAGCVGFKLDPHVREMVLSAAACLIASELGVVPMFLVRGAPQGAVAQAGLVATMVHLMGCLALVGVPMMLLKAALLATAVVAWVLPLYWLTLVVLVVYIIKSIRAAAPRTTATTTTTTNAGTR